MVFHRLNFGFEDISSNSYLNNPVNFSLCKIVSIIAYVYNVSPLDMVGTQMVI
jgi:hypothetical protein